MGELYRQRLRVLFGAAGNSLMLLALEPLETLQIGLTLKI